MSRWPWKHRSAAVLSSDAGRRQPTPQKARYAGISSAVATSESSDRRPHLENDNRTLKIVYQTGGCDRDGGAIADESADKVVVDAWKFVRTGKGFACTADIRESSATVTLDAPLDDRALVGGCCPGKEAVSENQVCRDANRGPF
ncbi:MAG: hypothetical protein WD646_04520 [Actinomycetota bacterium]